MTEALKSCVHVTCSPNIIKTYFWFLVYIFDDKANRIIKININTINIIIETIKIITKIITKIIIITIINIINKIINLIIIIINIIIKIINFINSFQKINSDLS